MSRHAKKSGIGGSDAEGSQQSELEDAVASTTMPATTSGELFGPRVKKISEQLEDDSADDEPPSCSDEEARYHKEEIGELPAEFWHLQKLVKYMKAGNQTATIVSLCLLKDFDLENKLIQRIISDMGGLEMLVNLLETRDQKCQHGALAALLRISSAYDMRRQLTDLGVVSPLIQLLRHPARDLQVLTVETLANVALVRKARKQFRKRGGIPLLLDVMDVPETVVLRPAKENEPNERELLDVAIGCAKLLDSLSKGPKIKEELRKHGVVFLLARFLKSPTTELVVPTVGAVYQCSDTSAFRLAYEKLDVIFDVVRHLGNSDFKLKENCALAIFRCAENEVTRNIIREAGGLDPLCKLALDKEARSNKRLLAAVVGAIWKCAKSSKNVSRFNENNLTDTLAHLLDENENEDVLANAVGALAECCKDPANREDLLNTGCIPNLIKLMNATYEPLLANIPLVIGELAQTERCMDVVNDPEHKNDGVRLVWSLLKHPSDRVKRSACLALVPCIRHAKNSAEMVRAFTGGLELTVSLLDNKDTEVLSAVCATIAEIALDMENLGILTDYGVVGKLADLVHTEDENLRANLALAIAYCSEWTGNNYEFGRLNAVAPLVNYLSSKNKEVLKGVCIAFYHLSKEPSNCVTMHTCGVVKHVLRLVGSEDSEVQIAAATTIRHIRKLALTAEKFHYKEINTLAETDFEK